MCFISLREFFSLIDQFSEIDEIKLIYIISINLYQGIMFPIQ